MDNRMKKKVSLPISIAAVWMLIQLLLFTLKVPHHFKIGIYFNLFFILAVIVLTLYLQVKREKEFHTFATNFKNCLKSSGKYILLNLVFLFAYFKFINPQFLNGLKEQRIEMIESQEKDWPSIQANNDFYKNTSFEEYYEKAKSSAEILSSVSLNMSFYFLGLFFMSVFYSVAVPLFYKKIVLRI
jgi:hypothetical protein